MPNINFEIRSDQSNRRPYAHHGETFNVLMHCWPLGPLLGAVVCWSELQLVHPTPRAPRPEY